MINIFFDIEADGLLHEWEPEAATRIDCCVALEEHPKTGRSAWIDDWYGGHESQETVFVIGHNIFDYDLPMLKKFRGWEYDIFPDTLNGQHVEFVDTLILSKLLNPDRDYPEGFLAQWKPNFVGQKLPGPHSLEVWAYRLNMKKPCLVYGDKMGNVPHEVSVSQAKADIEITRGVYYALMEEAKRYSLNLRKPLKIEQAVRYIVSQGAEYGVVFDQQKAESCILDLDQKMQEIAEKIEPLLPHRQLPKSKVKYPPKRRFKKDGSPNAFAVRYFGDALSEGRDGQWYVIVSEGEAELLRDWPPDVPFGEDTAPMTMADQKDIKQWLMEEHGWKPTLWNTDKDGERTTPKFHYQHKLCEDLERLGEVVPVVKDIILWLSYRNRRNVIKSKNGTGWLNHPRLNIDGRLPADADTMGAATFRFTHRCVANIPRASSVYGEEMRSLFCSPPDMDMVGWDAAQLEDRCKAHYCYEYTGGREYAEKLLDPEYSAHEENMEIWGLPKPKCKNGHFALQYGCKPQKLSDTLGVDLSQAEVWWDDWWNRNLPLKEFVNHIEFIWEAYDRQFLPGIDGRLIPTRKRHALANSLFQSAGVIAMKWAMVYWWLEVRKRGIPAVQIIHYHDEAVVVCPPEWTKVVGELGVWSIKKAGEVLNFNVPLLSEYSVGKTWLDVH